MSPTERRLEILAVLQAWPGITAPALAERFVVSERTVRRDVEHLRRIGYGIEGEPGRYGGYALAGGTKLPPLLLDADEAAAVALGLTADLGVAGLEVAAGTALAKVTESAPARARSALTAVAATTQADSDPRHHGSSRVLLALAHACRQGSPVHLRHRRFGVEHRRHVQPHRLVKVSSRWYLIAYTDGRDEWSVYAVARITRVDPAGGSLSTPPPPADAADFVRAFLATGPARYGVRVRLHTSADLARDLVRPATGTITDDGPTCLLSLGTDDLDWAARYLVYLNVDFDVLAPAELSTALHSLGDWLSRRHPA
ncbi:MAG TPA: WYL domain-containing protein [Propionibacteriaceae bacterium]|jgi:predicted DNA-binding transcriptional regulator YafY|nr:WYL domain-containing protein [Propionibacteriaceae bacterium]